MATKKTETMIKITRTRSGIGSKRNHRETLRSLGLRKIGDSVVRSNDAVTAGMVRAVAHMVTVEEAN
ncbi:MAG: 50S ribosomal protein L30 [Propionibacteriaceae bacterium]|jgi:large subunit ribosomal protein L30|nr:50S ribosomal protein L30 [Propionibacteriaceae bacterium]